MICENCGKTHAGEYGSGRFCCSSCARQFSSMLKREEVNAKVSATLKGRVSGNREYQSGYTRTDDIKRKIGESVKRRSEEKQNALPFNEKSHPEKRRIVLREQNGVCLFCGLNEWLGQPLILELDHVNGDRLDETRGNLRMLCPNCHSTTPTYKFRGRTHKKRS